MFEPKLTATQEREHQRLRIEANGLALESHDPGADVEIELLHVRAFAPGNYRLDLAGLGPCLGIVIQDTRTRVALAAHFAEVEGADAKAFDAFRAIARGAFLTPSRCQVVVAGCGVSDGRDGTAARGIQQALIGRLTNDGYLGERIEAHWSHGRLASGFYFDMGTGEVEVDREE